MATVLLERGVSVWNPPLLIPALNLLFGLVALFAALLSARSYIEARSRRGLLLGASMFAYSLGILAAAAYSQAGDPNASSAAYVSMAAMSGLFALSIVAGRRLRLPVDPGARRRQLAAAFSPVLAVLLVLGLLIARRAVPVFLLEGMGPTAFGSSACLATASLFAVSAVLLLARRGARALRFELWCGLGLALIALGLVGQCLGTSAGDRLNWLGRLTGYAGVIYVLVAAISSMRRSGAWLLPVERALHESEETFRVLAEMSSAAFWLYQDEALVYVNDAAATLSGYTKAELLGMRFWDIAHPEHAESLRELGRGIQEGKAGASKLEVMLRRKDGETRWAELSSGKTEYHGRPAGIASMYDITERKRTEDYLRRQAMILEAISDAIIVTDTSFRIRSWNTRAERLYGWTEAEVLGRPAKEVLESELLGIDRAEAYRRLESGESVNMVSYQRTKGGDRLYVLGYTVPLRDARGAITGYVAINHDETARKSAEVALLASEERLKFHLENSPLAVVEWDSDFVVTQWSLEAERIFEWKKEEVLGRRIDQLDLILVDDLPIVERTMERLVSGRERTVVSSNRNIAKSRRILDCTWYNSVLLDDKGRMASVMSLVQDNTELKHRQEEIAAQAAKLERANEELRSNNEELVEVSRSLGEARSYLDSLITYANAPIIVWDAHFAITRFNQAFERLSGYRAEEVLGRRLSVLFPPSSQEEALAKIRKTLEGEQWESVEIPILYRHGGVRTALWNSANIYGESG
ncbi:MAG TPA: PAS domain S-box protein, partial [Rectinemataceae bacterium]|nr:PAS domain S-box protein [Rectinemataceae bacterium]